MPIMTAITALTVGGSVASAVVGSNATQSAANTEAAGAQQAAQLAQTSATSANTAIGNELPQLAALNKTNQAALSPYINTGTTALSQIAAGTQPGGSLVPSFNANLVNQYAPSEAFQLQQGQQAVMNQASAMGTPLTGGTLKELTQYEQGIASTNYQNAFNDYMAQIQQNYNMLANTANMGLSATNSALQGNQWLGSAELQGTEQQGTNTMTAAQISGNAAVGAANAQAAGTIGSANAITGGISSAINGITQPLTLSAVLAGLNSAPPATNAQVQAVNGAAAPSVSPSLFTNSGYLTPTNPYALNNVGTAPLASQVLSEGIGG
jgi:hypothetical protein